MAKALRQVKGANIPPNGWMDENAWFDSVGPTVEVYLKLKLYSTWVVTNNTFLYPMEALNVAFKAHI